MNLDPHKWADTPITEGRVIWNDDGYDNVQVVENSDAMVVIDGLIATHAVMARGGASKVSPFWEGGLGGPRLSLVRQPVLWRLLEANVLLRDLDLELLVEEAYRPPKVQMAGFCDVFWRQFPNVPPDQRSDFLAKMPQSDVLKYGKTANKGFLAAGVDTESVQFNQMCVGVTDDLREKLREYLKYRGNLESGFLPLDLKVTKPHGTGGSVDVVLRQISTRQPVFMGSPADDTGSVVRVLDYFEWASRDEYNTLFETDHKLREYCWDFYPARRVIIDDDLEAARANRRILFWAMQAVGASGYNEDREFGEYWHWNFGRHGGEFPGAGNGCHSLLKLVKDPETGTFVAVWGAEEAHRQAALILGNSVIY